MQTEWQTIGPEQTFWKSVLGVHCLPRPVCPRTYDDCKMSRQNQQSDCAPSEDSDQPGDPPSLIRVFAVHTKKPWVLSYPLSAQRRLRSDWADAQADLSLHWAQSFCWFCHEAAQIHLTHIKQWTISLTSVQSCKQYRLSNLYIHYRPLSF